MKQGHFILSASIATALAGASVFAQPAAAVGIVASVGAGEASRVTETVNTKLMATVQNTHLGFAQKQSPIRALDSATKMSHLQLVLKPSAARQAALASLVADQHDPKSARFHQWLTPQQFGDSYGVTDADISAVTAWLKSEGFTVNTVYPNKSQIDFSGTVGQVNKAFHTQESVYALGTGGEKHVSNTGDISIPAALKDVVSGVMGLNDFHPKALHTASKLAQRNPSTGRFNLQAAGGTGVKGQSIQFPNPNNRAQGTRALVPNDLATMYGVNTLRKNGVTGKGVTIAVVDTNNMVASDWTNFTSQFNLTRFGGTFAIVHPQPVSGASNCADPDVANPKGTKYYDPDDGETLLDAEWSTAIAPGANIVVATCASFTNNGDGTYSYATDNFFGGVFIAATNLINAPTGRPDIISASYGYGESFTDSASKAAIDLMWAQADVEGISVFVSTGDSGSNPSFNGGLINGSQGAPGVDANSFATSANVTAVGGTDTADVLDGTTSKYFAPTPSVVGGSALSYVPEIPWNQSCGNGVAAKSLGYNRPIGFCNDAFRGATTYENNTPFTSEAGSGGPSSVDRKPVWQRQVYNTARDQSRDLPDVALFAGSYGDDTFVLTCTNAYPCMPGFTGSYELSGGTSLASPMFAGIQALIDQGLAARGLSVDQGNAAPTLYALAADEYGSALRPNTSGLSTCNSDNGATGTSSCVFHNVTRGSISSGCYSISPTFTTSNCFYYASEPAGTDSKGVALTANIGLTTADANPTAYTPTNKAFPAQPGWSFAAGLGSVNATNLLIAWRAFVGAPPATAAVTTK
jgi:subtilase family serine protease